MTNARHTPGPWSQCRDAEACFEDDRFVVSQDGTRIADAYPPDYPDGDLGLPGEDEFITAWADAEREEAFSIMDDIVALAQDNILPAEAIAKAKRG